jgi:putative DNA methylase
MGQRLMAIVAEGHRGRVYLSPTSEHEQVALSAQPSDIPDTDLPEKALGFRVQEYGMTKWSQLFTSRQLSALTTFTNIVGIAIEKIKKDALKAGLPDDDFRFEQNGSGATAYAEALGVYLAFGVNRTVHSVCSFVKWNNARDQSNVVFSRQALAMLWDFADVNPFAGAAGDLAISCEGVAKGIAASDGLPAAGFAKQADAAIQTISAGKVISTDPPYYDNIGYADLSDFFYVWLRRSLKSHFPDLFATLAVPKAQELVATPFRHGNREKAESFFLDGMTHAMHRLAEQSHPAFPVSIYYAFKQSESNDEKGTTNTGWDTFLEAVIKAGFAITGTWPVRTEREGRPVGNGTNSLASSIVLVCRPHKDPAPVTTRREFLNLLKAELPPALTHLQAGNIAPVDLAQAAIGPGMAVYTRFAKVLDADGVALSVRSALALINQTLDESLAEQEGDFDADTRWALAWFEQMGFDEGEYGVAEQLSKAKNTAVTGLVESGIVQSGRGKVKLLRPSELTDVWDPQTDQRLTTWETVHRLIQAQADSGESGAAIIVAKLGGKAETARDLCYRLYTLCERKKRATDAMSYNALVQSWPEIVRIARQNPQSAGSAGDLFIQE